MRREHIANHNDVITVFPFFTWTKCEFCESEYKREKMYQWVAYGRFFEYACKHCVGSIEHCNERIERRRQLILSNRPPAPPPPMRKG